VSGSYSIFGWRLSESLWLDGVGIWIIVVGTGRELVAIRRQHSHLLAHALRILAYLLAGSFFFVAVKYLAKANAAHWSLLLMLVLIASAICIFITAGRRIAASGRLGKHADHGQQFNTQAEHSPLDP
jgi:hypothetical protein